MTLTIDCMASYENSSAQSRGTRETEIWKWKKDSVNSTTDKRLVSSELELGSEIAFTERGKRKLSSQLWSCGFTIDSRCTVIRPEFGYFSFDFPLVFPINIPASSIWRGLICAFILIWKTVNAICPQFIVFMLPRMEEWKFCSVIWISMHTKNLY